MTDRTAVTRIANYLRARIAARADIALVGPFLIIFDRDSSNRYRNYAFPDNGAEPTPQEVRQLIMAFEERRRVPRLEYVPELAPAVLRGLIETGFKAEGHLPLLVSGETRSQQPPAGVAISIVSADEDLESAASVQNEAYGEPATSASDIARLRSTVTRGGAVALARNAETGAALGSGLYSAPIRGATEIAALGVRSGYRRKGIGGALIGVLLGEARAQQIEFPFLMAAHDEEARLYRRLGFADCGTVLHISR